jgi:beta-glucosidase
MPNSPQYPFGFGLSYTKFTYDSMQVDRMTFNMSETIECSVRVTNSGSREGEEVVQLYVRDMVGSVTRPVKELKGFQKIKLSPGESKNVIFKLTAKDLAFHTADMTFTAEPGEFLFMVGTDSATLQHKKVRLTK